MNFLITGSGGFVGRHLVKRVKKKFPEAKILGLYRSSLKQKVDNVVYKKVDLNDFRALFKIFNFFVPDYIIHLAAESSVNYSWKNPANSLENNLNIYLNFLEALRKLKLYPKILSVGSSEVYGKVSKKDLPISENLNLNPLNPYAVFRVAQENISRVYNNSFDFNIIMTRSFNHFGQGQDHRFFIPNLIRQILDPQINNIKLGNLEIVRDYIYIQDVVDAYINLLFQGEKNNIYNVSTGKGYKLYQILEIIEEITEVKKPTLTDPNLIRPSDNPIIIGDNSKIIRETGWTPKISLRGGLGRILKDHKKIE
tara:strand:+ start:1362 stop:2291 length:930 start_codon:yes stop_codon:yes gene_type:complete